MLLEKLNAQGLLSITSVLGPTSEKKTFAFRGDLVLKPGELKEGSERDRKPPEFVIHQAVILTDAEKFLFVGGLLHELDKLSMFVDKYQDVLSADTIILLHIENIDCKMQVEHAGCRFQLIPYTQGMIWNELLEELYIEKSDLKGQSAEDKVATVFAAAKDYSIKSDAISYEEALGKTIEVVKDMAVGPI